MTRSLQPIDRVSFDIDHGTSDTPPPRPTGYRNFASRFAAIVARTAEWAKANGIDFRPFRFHDLRHYHAVTWLKDGRSIYDLQNRLGHTSIKTTEMYLRYLTPDEERIAKGIAARAAAPVAPKLKVLRGDQSNG